MKLIIVGLGGIGSHLLLPLMQYINYEEDSFNEVWFVDGDTYETKNLKRQHVVRNNENKALAQMNYYRELFPNQTIMYVDKYINIDNISKIVSDDDVVLLCVDNNKTRKLFEDYFENINTLTVISGGNELYDGNVMITQKVKGEFTSRKFSEMHPELSEPTDRSPDEMSCEELEDSAPQIGIVNATVGDLMRRTLYAMMSGRGINYDEIFVNCQTGMEKAVLNPISKERLLIKNGTL